MYTGMDLQCSLQEILPGMQGVKTMKHKHTYFLVWTQPIHQTKVPRQASRVLCSPLSLLCIQPPIGMILPLVKNEKHVSYANVLP